jgi:ABC-type multidrug transport system ATPase subunit
VSAPLLACDRPRFVGGDLELGQFQALGPRLALVGDWGPLFGLIAGQQRLAGGSVRLGGLDAEGAAATGRVGLLLREGPLPPSWTLREVLHRSAALLGHSSRRSSALAEDSARELGLVPLLGKKLARLTPAQQRAAGIASAHLGNPRLLALEDPFGSLQPSEQVEVARVLDRALAGRAAIISVRALPGSPESDRFAQSCDELLFLSRYGLGARGRYAELLAGATSYRVVVLRHAAALLSRLGQAGYDARQVTSTEVSALVVGDPEGLGTRPLCAASLLADAPIVELLPLNPGVARQAQPEP